MHSPVPLRSTVRAQSRRGITWAGLWLCCRWWSGRGERVKGVNTHDERLGVSSHSLQFKAGRLKRRGKKAVRSRRTASQPPGIRVVGEKYIHAFQGLKESSELKGGPGFGSRKKGRGAWEKRLRVWVLFWWMVLEVQRTSEEVQERRRWGQGKRHVQLHQDLCARYEGWCGSLGFSGSLSRS